MLSPFFLFLMLLGGMLIPFQAAINAGLARTLGHPILAATLSTTVSFTSLLMIALVMRLSLPSLSTALSTPWWALAGGGLIGAYVVFISLMAAPILGVTTLFAALLAGQLMISVALDHFGYLGLETQPINSGRLIGVLLLIAGVYLIRRF